MPNLNMLVGLVVAIVLAATLWLFNPFSRARADSVVIAAPAGAGPQSQALARSIALDLSRGIWPDFCSDSNLPYDCRKEAAKYR